MGTRAMYGFYKDGKTKGMYNHMDGYPSHLGEAIVQFLCETEPAKLPAIFDNIELVDERKKPTKKQIEKMMAFNDELSPAHFEGTDAWYGVLRQYMGDPSAYRDGLPYMIDGAEFIQDSLFCEWAYVINIDDGVLEVYEGFQEKSDQNRYYDPKVEKADYKNCRLIRTIPFDKLEIGMMAELEEILRAAN